MHCACIVQLLLYILHVLTATLRWARILDMYPWAWSYSQPNTSVNILSGGSFPKRGVRKRGVRVNHVNPLGNGSERDGCESDKR